MPKCDFNKVAMQLYWNHTSAWVLSCKFAAFFQNTFSQVELRVAASGELSSLTFLVTAKLSNYVKRLTQIYQASFLQ